MESLFASYEVRYMKAKGSPPINEMAKYTFPKVKIQMMKDMGDPGKKYLISADRYNGSKRIWEV